MTSEKQNSPSGEHRSAYETAETLAEIDTTATELKPPPSDPKCQHACKKNKHWLDYATFGMEFLGLVVLCVYAGYTIKIYCATQKAANAAASATEIASKQFKMDESAQITITNLRWRRDSNNNRMSGICADNGATQHICFELDFSNTGKTAATASGVTSHVVPPRSIQRAEQIIQEFTPIRDTRCCSCCGRKP